MTKVLLAVAVLLGFADRCWAESYALEFTKTTNVAQVRDLSDFYNPYFLPIAVTYSGRVVVDHITDADNAPFGIFFINQSRSYARVHSDGLFDERFTGNIQADIDCFYAPGYCVPGASFVSRITLNCVPYNCEPVAVVSDGIVGLKGDKRYFWSSGSYPSITVASIPEPWVWIEFITGFAVIGAFIRVKSRPVFA